MRKVANSIEKLPIYRCSRLTYINVDHGEGRVDASERDRGNSGFRGALIAKVFWYVRSWHKADMPVAAIDVRFWGKSGHRDCTAKCLLLTQSGHRAPQPIVVRASAFQLLA